MNYQKPTTNFKAGAFARRFKNRIYRSFFLLFAMVLLCSHNLYIKMDGYFLQAYQEATLSLYNGTFENSENIITRDRMLDASIVSQGERVAINPEQWQDQDSTITRLTFKTGGAGTYVAGVSTKARNIELSADKFNDYLEHDGVLDMLEQRTTGNLLDQDAVESYEKHIKAIYQVGAVKTDDWSTVLGYPIEFVPQANPYETYSGEKLEVQLLIDGQPLSNQLVYADYIKAANAHTHSHTHEHDGEKYSHDHEHAGEHSHDGQSESEQGHTHSSAQQLRTNEQGMVVVDLPEDGIYYLRTIHMVNVADGELTHRSKWATLTFEVTHKHEHEHDQHHHDHDHDHDHDHKKGIPTWVFVLGSAIVIAVLFLFFREND